MSDDFINMDIPKGKLIIALFIIFFVSGLIIGFAVGGYMQDKQWRHYQELEQTDRELSYESYENQEDVLQWE